MRTAIAFSLFVSFSAFAFAAPAHPRQIDVAVVAPPSVTDALLKGIFAEADEIWAPADVTFQWRRSSETKANRDNALVLMFDRPAGRSSEAQAPLGWITFESGRPGHTIHLAPANAESLIRRTPTAHDTTLGEHEALLGRAMGRAFAHEVGHYLLKSKTHSRRGLMRAAWPTEELLSQDRARFGLAADEQATVRSPTAFILEELVQFDAVLARHAAQTALVAGNLVPDLDALTSHEF